MSQESKSQPEIHTILHKLLSIVMELSDGINSESAKKWLQLTTEELIKERKDKGAETYGELNADHVAQYGKDMFTAGLSAGILLGLVYDEVRQQKKHEFIRSTGGYVPLPFDLQML